MPFFMYRVAKIKDKDHGHFHVPRKSASIKEKEMNTTQQDTFPTETARAVDPLDAWSDAEQSAFGYLCRVTDTQPEVAAFLGEIDGVMDSWYFANDVQNRGGEVNFAPAPHPTFVLPYVLVATFSSRRALQRFVMKVFQACPVRPGGALECLRLSEDGIGAIRLGSKVFFNETEPRAFWQVTLTFDLVVRVKP